MKLKGKTSIITGGATGIGKSIATLFAKEGASIALIDVNDDYGQSTEREIKEYFPNSNTRFYKSDVKNFDDIENIFNKIMKDFASIDILINNAGITRDNFLLNMSPKDWDEVIQVNLTGVFNCGKAASKFMVEQGGGIIINISSIVGLYGNIGQTNYSASKAGVIGITKTWAKELGLKGIRCNAIAPGFIATEMTLKVPEKILNYIKEKTPLKRIGTPDDIAYACLFLASDEASFINGAILTVDGGLTL